jgi:hypothetical protein
VQITTGITPQYLIDALNTGGTFGSYRGRNMSDRRSLIKANPDVYDQAQQKVKELLRSYVDEWLNTGVTDGVEVPAARKLQDTENAYDAVQGYVDKYPPRVFASDQGLGALFGGPRTRVGGSFQSDHADPSQWRVVPAQDDPLTDAEDEAARIFTLLIDAPWRDRIYKCRKCEGYGVLSRKPAPHYIRGVHCARCRSRVTALASTKKKRDAKFEERLELAAEYWQRSKKRKDGDRKAYVVAKMNEHLLHGEHIQVNWVTWNLSAIEKEAEKRSAKR